LRGVIITRHDAARRIGWFVALQASGIACLTAVALPLRWHLKAV
jgi:hypothetical protein